MKTSCELSSGAADKNMRDTSAGWHAALGLTILSVLALLGLYHSTLLSMVAIWWRSETFAHGFVIFPISIWLIWRRRLQVARLSPRPDYRALPLLFFLGAAWLVAHAADVVVGEQLAFIGMVPLLCWLMLGWPVFSELAFPLGFLLFSVPIGEFLIPPMMDFTADFTVKMLQITGIPVYREGTFFSIPSGDWSVVEGCSGLRYLIASVTLGCLYAYLTYRSQIRRLVFVILALVFPVVANGLRAYMIVMIAHLSGMKLALGVDHFIYGWVFFGAVMLLMFWIGSFWSEPEQEGINPSPVSGGAQTDRRSISKLIKSAGIALALSALWPVRAAYIESLVAERNTPVQLLVPQPTGHWQSIKFLTDWEPFYVGADAEVSAFFGDSSSRIGLYLMYYRGQEQDAELINSQNILIRQKHPVWKMPEEKPVEIQLNGIPVTVWQGRLNSPGQNLLTWRWNWVSGRYTANDYLGKLLEAKDKLLGTIRDGAAIIVVTEYDENIEEASQALQRFIDAMLPSLEQSLRQAAES